MNQEATRSGDVESDFDDIAFTDVVLNLFAILLIFLLIVPFSLRKEDAEAPTLNREEEPFFVVRDCYISALRPASKFLLIDQNGLSELDYDGLGVDYAQSGGSSARSGPLSANVTVFDDGRDANNFKIVSSLERDPVNAENALPAGNLTAWRSYLDERVYRGGYVPFFDVKPGQIGDFAPLYDALIAEGKRFRWRLSSKTSMNRYRTETMFEVGEMCR